MSTFGAPEPPSVQSVAPPPFEPSSPVVGGDAGPDAESGHSRGFRAVAGGGIAVLVAGGVAAAVLAFGLLRGSADSMVSFAPSDTAVYFNLDLEPSVGQQLALNNILGKFPGLAGSSRDATINQWLDNGLQSSGLSHTAVRSWLGSQLSLIVLRSSGGATPAAVSLMASTNDAAAQAMFTKLKAGPLGHGEHWSTATYDGVTVHVVQDASGISAVWAVTSHTVIVGTSESAVDEVIDTSQGKHASLTSQTDYTTAQSRVQSDRIAFLYLDLPRVGAMIPSVGATAVTSALRGYQGVAEALVASSSGITVSGTVDFDPAKLSAVQRATLRVGAHTNGALAYVPANAFGFVTLTGLPEALKSLASLAGTGLGLSGSQALDQLGITGSSGIISHLTGDAGFEVDQVPGTSVPSGALLIATDSTTATQVFLDQLATEACAIAHGCASPAATHQTYHGVTVSSITVTGVDSAQLSPSWAVDNGWAIVASTPAEVRAIIDAKLGTNVTTSPQFKAVASQVGTSNNGMFYLNVQKLVAAVRAVLPSEFRATFDAQVAPYLSPVQAIGSSTQSFNDHVMTTEFVLFR